VETAQRILSIDLTAETARMLVVTFPVLAVGCVWLWRWRPREWWNAWLGALGAAACAGAASLLVEIVVWGVVVLGRVQPPTLWIASIPLAIVGWPIVAAVLLIHWNASVSTPGTLRVLRCLAVAFVILAFVIPYAAARSTAEARRLFMAAVCP